MLLQIVAYLAIVLAGARPVYVDRTALVRRITLVVDGSASMQTAYGDGSVFDNAVQRLRKMLDRLSPQDDLTLHLYPPHRIHEGPPSGISSLLTDLRPSQGNASFPDFLRGLPRSPGRPIYFFTDGSDGAALAHVIPVKCGVPQTDNAGMIALTIRHHRIFTVIRNFSARPISADLIVMGDKEILHRQPISLGPQQQRSWSKLLALDPYHTVTLRWDRLDNFPLDDEIYAVRSPAVSVFLPPQASAYTRMCKAIPGIRIADDPASAHFAFVSSSALFGVEGGWLLCRNDFTPRLLVAAPQNISAPLWAADPLLDAVYPELIEISRSAVLKPPLPEDAQILLDSSEGTVMAYGRSWFFSGFSPENSNWPQLPCFPIFGYNLWEYLCPDRDRFVYLAADKDHPQIGIFQDGSKKVAVNLLSEEESDNRGGQTDVDWPPPPIVSPASTELRPFLIILAALSLLLLWRRER